MITRRNDNNSFAPYRRIEEVEAVVDKANFDFWQIQLDKALDERLFQTDPDKFNEIVEGYKKAKKSLDKRQEL